MIAQIIVFSRKTDAQKRKILCFVPQKLRKSFANGNPNINFIITFERPYRKEFKTNSIL